MVPDAGKVVVMVMVVVPYAAGAVMVSDGILSRCSDGAVMVQ